MAGNEQLPASGFLARLMAQRDEPLGTIVVAAILSMLPLIFIKRIPVIVAAITALIIIPYILVLASLLIRRVRGWPHPRSQFRLGTCGLPITPIPLIPTAHPPFHPSYPRPPTHPVLPPL